MSPETETISKPRRLTRRAFFKRLAGVASVPFVGGAYSMQVEPFWPEFPEMAMPIRGLPEAFDGFRLTQLTDLHTGDKVPLSYLQEVIDRVKNEVKPDLLVVTGDLLNHAPRWVTRGAALLANFPAPVLMSLGNHDYGVYRTDDDNEDPDLDATLTTELRRIGVNVLRNESHKIKRGSDHLTFNGLEDYWFGNFDPRAAFAGLDENQPIITLSHNPDTAHLLDRYGPRLILSGHTHGGQVRIPPFGAPLLPVDDRRYDKGLFQLKNSKLYVSRGVGYIKRIRFCCRPEIPTFRLTCG